MLCWQNGSDFWRVRINNDALRVWIVDVTIIHSSNRPSRHVRKLATWIAKRINQFEALVIDNCAYQHVCELAATPQFACWHSGEQDTLGLSEVQIEPNQTDTVAAFIVPEGDPYFECAVQVPIIWAQDAPVAFGDPQWVGWRSR